MVESLIGFGVLLLMVLLRVPIAFAMGLIGFVGFGSIAQECVRLLAPFAPKVEAFDPWLKASGATFENVTFSNLEQVTTGNRLVVIAATPTEEESSSCVLKDEDGASWFGGDSLLMV